MPEPRRRMFASKIHRATVTGADVDYEGSVTIDRDLLDAAGILEWEEVQIWDVTNGARLATYAIAGERGSGDICINGAAAHLVRPGDLVILATFVDLDVTTRRPSCSSTSGTRCASGAPRSPDRRPPPRSTDPGRGTGCRSPDQDREDDSQFEDQGVIS